MLKDCAREDRILHYEDVYPLLYLKCRLFERKEKRIIKHLVVDEMQDYTFLQYTLLHNFYQHENFGNKIHDSLAFYYSPFLPLTARRNPCHFY